MLTEILFPGTEIPEIVAEVLRAGEREKGAEAHGTEQAEQETATNPDDEKRWKNSYATMIDVNVSIKNKDQIC